MSSLRFSLISLATIFVLVTSQYGSYGYRNYGGPPDYPPQYGPVGGVDSSVENFDETELHQIRRYGTRQRIGTGTGGSGTLHHVHHYPNDGPYYGPSGYGGGYYGGAYQPGGLVGGLLTFLVGKK